MKDLHFKNASSTNNPLQRFEYGHDPLDQRVFARVTQRIANGTPRENERSYLYGYDRLGRLVASQMGVLDSSNAAVGMPVSGAAVRDSLWTMDLLGNWVGDSQQSLPGRRTLGVPQTTGPPSRDVSVTDSVNRTNAVTQRARVDGGTASTLDPVHDAAGNLILDADYFYQYDAWNRLIKVSNRGTLVLSLGTGQGGGLLAVSGTPGAWIVHYTYDGLGRLIRKQSPWPTLDPYGRPQVRTEHFYYDGVRRVQEVVTDPIALESETDPIGIDDEAELPPLATASLTRREYVHSPGYVDEVVAQVDVSAGVGASHGPDRPAWVIQDANYNLVGLVGDDGTLLHQYTWDPYGEPVAIERFDTGAGGTGGSPAPFENRIGHQGLFFDRFDGQANNVLLPQLWVEPGTGLSAKGLYQNRNRSYSPGLGRFVQRDPNALGQVLAQAAHASMCVNVPTLQLQMAYRDGMSLYQYTRSRPGMGTDPQGLFDFSLASVLGASTTTSDLQMEWSSTLGDVHDRLEVAIGGIFDAASLDQMADADWALDWSTPDDMYSSSASYSEGTGSWAGWFDGARASSGDTELESAARKIPNFGKGLSGTATGGGVYQLLEKGKTVYVGRTIDFDRRKAEHARDPRFRNCQFERIHQNLTHDQMRGLEQHEMNRARSNGAQLKNKVRGVSKANRYRPEYLRAARGFLRRMPL